MSRSAALRALHAYRGAKDREWSRTLRRFGYLASAEMVEARAARHERAAKGQEAPPELPDGASSASLSLTDPTQD